MTAAMQQIKDTIGLKEALRRLLRAYARWNLDLANGVDTPNKRTAADIENNYLEDIMRLFR